MTGFVVSWIVQIDGRGAESGRHRIVAALDRPSAVEVALDQEYLVGVPASVHPLVEWEWPEDPGRGAGGRFSRMLEGS